MAKTAAVKIEVRWREQGTDQWSDIQSVPVTSKIVVEGLDRTKTYEFEYRGVSACGARSAWGSTAHAIPDVGPNNIVLADVKTQADNAAADALAANQELANIASDNVLSQGEKPVVIRDYNVISSEQAGIDAQASSFGITTEKTAYDNAVTALSSYLATLTSPTAWNNLTGDTTIVGTTFRSKFQDVYTNRQTLLNKIASVAATEATWSGVTGTGKPQDNATVGATLGPGGNVNGAVDGNGRALIDFSQGGHNYKILDYIGDGSTYGRPLYSRLNAGNPLIDFSAGYHLNKNIDNVADGTTYYRIPAANLDSNRRALIDFTQSTHIGKVLDNIGDGATYGRALGSRLNAGNPLIDFAAGYHLNKNVDNIADGTTYGRALASRLSSGKPLIDFSEGIHANKNLDYIANTSSYAKSPAMGGSSIVVPNANFLAPIDGAGNVPGWTSANGGVLSYYTTNASPFTNVQCLHVTFTGSSPNGFGASSTPNFKADPGDTFYVKGWAFADTGAMAQIIVYFFSSAGVYLGQITAQTTSYGSWQQISASGAAPSGTSQAFIRVFNPNTGGGSSYFYGISVSRAQSIDNEVIDGPTYGRTVQSRLSSGVPFIDFAAGIHLNKNIDNVADGATFARVSTNAVTGGNIDFAKSGFANKTVDNVGDGTTYARIKGTELSSGVHKLGVAGSGALLGNQLNAPNSLTLNYGASRTATAVTATSAGVASINAFTFKMGGAAVSYNAVSNAVTGLTVGVTYQIYCHDAGGTGGTKTWYAVAGTQTDALSISDDVVIAGQVTIPSSGSSGGGGTGCPVVGAWVIRRTIDGPAWAQAGDVVVGDELLLTSGDWGRVSHSRTVLQPCVQVRDENGFTLSCSSSAPLGRTDGSQVLAPDAEGELIESRTGIVKGSSRVAGVRDIGDQWVQHITCENDFFWVGDQTDRLFSHHNLKP